MTESLKFGDGFELDLRAYELRRGSRVLKLERIPMDLLVLLIERRGELVSREQIIERIWGKDVFLDTDGSINSAVRKIRQVLKDDAEQPRFVQTVSGKGYRFIAPLQRTVQQPPLGPEPAKAPDASLLGKKFSDYRILQILGGGGMGVVYKAEDLKLGRLVALKFLPAEAAAKGPGLEQLRQEARAVSALDHPNVCSIYQLGEDDGQTFIVMQFLEGQTVREWIEAHAAEETNRRVEKVVDIATQIASGLEAAHEKGIIHRDIKPANLFITSRGQAKVLDFGIAKIADAGEFPDIGKTSGQEVAKEGLSQPDLQLTRTGAGGGGTPSYLSPEQVARTKVDTRTDLFSFGAVLYEMATGQRAFSGNTAAEVREAISSRSPVPTRLLDPNLPVELERIIARCLEKEPDKRYQTATQLRTDLQALGASLAVPKRRSPWLLAVAGVMVVAAVVFAIIPARLRDRLFHRAEPGTTSAPFKARPSIAVLGFKNLSGKEDEAWISTALSEMMDAELASGEQLRVVPGENVARMKVDLSLSAADSYAQDTLSRIRDHLNADLVVHGSYLALGKSAGGRIRIALQLQDTRGGETIAALSRDGLESDLAGMVTQSGASLREKLGIGDLSANDAARVRSSIPSNPEAAALYAAGLAKLRSFDAQTARDLLVKAIALDPRHAPSHAALSDAWSQLGYDLKAKEEAKKAVELSAGLSREDQLSIEGRYRETAREWPRAVEVYRSLFEFFPDDLDYGLRFARVQASAGSPKEAMATIETLTKWPPPYGNDPHIDLAEAKVAEKLGDLHRVEAAATRALEKGRLQGARTLTALALLTRGSIRNALGDNKDAIPDLEEAQTIFDALGDQVGVARVLNDLGIIQRHRSNLAEARKLLEESLEISRRTGNQLGMLKAEANLANVLWDQGDLARAEAAHRRCLTISRELGEKNSEAGALNNVAGLLTLQGKLPDARKMYDESLELSRSLGDQEGIGLLLGNIADILTRQGDLAAARKWAEEALATDRKAGNKSFEGYALHQLATVLLLQGDLPGASDRFKESAALRQEIGEKVNEAESRIGLATVGLASGDAAAAESEARTNAPIFHESAAIDDEALSYSLLSLALVVQGKTAQAQRASANAKEMLPKTMDEAARLQIEIAHSYVSGIASLSGSSGNDSRTTLADATKALEATRQRAGHLGYLGLELEARLRAGQLDMRAGKASSGRLQLDQLQKDAQSKGFLLTARQAKAALSGN